MRLVTLPLVPRSCQDRILHQTASTFLQTRASVFLASLHVLGIHSTGMPYWYNTRTEWERFIN